MATDDIVKNLAALRVAVGAGSWLAPGLAAKVFGLDLQNNPQAPYLARLFGVRDIALGLGALQSTGPERRRWLMLGVACDAADVLAGVLGTREGYLSRVSGALVTGTAVAATAMGAVALSGE
jgi:hypothetical protein